MFFYGRVLFKLGQCQNITVHINIATERCSRAAARYLRLPLFSPRWRRCHVNASEWVIYMKQCRWAVLVTSCELTQCKVICVCAEMCVVTQLWISAVLSFGMSLLYSAKKLVWRKRFGILLFWSEICDQDFFLPYQWLEYQTDLFSHYYQSWPHLVKACHS